MLCDQLVEDLAASATFVDSSRVLPHVFWTLHTSANLSALGQTARLVACGDVLQRVIGAVFCRRYDRKLADYFRPWSQYVNAPDDKADMQEHNMCRPRNNAGQQRAADERQRQFMAAKLERRAD